MTVHRKNPQRVRAQIVLKELKRCIPEAKTTLSYRTQFQLLMAVILSAQTTDKQVNKVTKELFKKYKTVDDVANVTAEIFAQDIRSIGLYKSKAKNIVLAAQMLKEKHKGGKIPKTMEELIELPGVGRKTANVVLAEAFGICEGIAVDTHVARLAKKFGLTKQTDPKKIEQDLMRIIPKSEWPTFTLRMIDYGRHFSPAHKKDDNNDPISLVLEKSKQIHR